MNQTKIKSALAALCLMFSITASAQTTVTHTVERGETVESIAKKYNVMPQDITNANPDAVELIFAGMKLDIPTSGKHNSTANNQTQSEQTVGNETFRNDVADNNTSTGSSNDNISGNDSEDSPWIFVDEIGLGFLKGGSSNYAYEASVGFAYHFTYNIYGSARIGYNSSNYSYHYNGDRETRSVENKTNLHFLQIPLEAGYMLQTTNKLWGIVPFAGITTNIGLPGKSKYRELGTGGSSESKKAKIGGKLGLEARLGVRLRIYGFNLSGSYHLPINKKQEEFFGKDSYPEVSIGYNF